MSKRKSKQVEAEQPKKRKKKSRHVKRLVGFTVIAGGAALALSQDLRNKVLDKLFGSEEEFQYTPPSDSSGGNGTPAGNGTPSSSS